MEGLIPLSGGTYAYLLATGKIVGSKNPEKMAEWRNKFGRMIKIISPFLVLWGLIRLSELLNGA